MRTFGTKKSVDQVKFELNPLNATMRAALASRSFKSPKVLSALPVVISSSMALSGIALWVPSSEVKAAPSAKVEASILSVANNNFSTVTNDASNSTLLIVTNATSATTWRSQWINLTIPDSYTTTLNVTTSVNDQGHITTDAAAYANRSASGIVISGGNDTDGADLYESVTVNIDNGKTVAGGTYGISITPTVDIDGVTINNNGTIFGDSGAGVHTSVSGGLTGLTINNRNGSISSRIGDGINVSGVAGMVTIDNNGSITANSTANLNVAAVSISNSNDVNITNRIGKSISSGNDGIRITGIANSVLITNEANATISGANVSGTREGYGIRIAEDWLTETSSNVSVGKTVSILNSGTISGDVAGVLIDGVGKSETEQASNGTVYVNNSGLITGRTGLKIQNVFETTALNATSTGDVNIVNSGNLSGSAGPGLFVKNVDGYVKVNVTSGGRIEGYDVGGNDGTALTVSNVGDYVKITNNGTIVGQQNNASATANAIFVSNADRSVTIENQSGGVIRRNTDGSVPTSATVISVDQTANASGNLSISNAGNITGAISLSSPNDIRFDNTGTGTWKVSGSDAFNAYGNTIVISNSGKVEIYGDTTIGNYQRLSVFENNNGTIDLTVNSTNASSPQISTLTIYTSVFQGAVSGGASGPSNIIIDANLSGTASSSASLVADSIVINGNATGVTKVQIMDSAPGVAGSYAKAGITVVNVSDNTALPDAFVLKDGSINKGLWQYDLFSTSAGEDARVWKLASVPSDHAHELPAMQTAAQETWHQSSAAWVDHTNNVRLKLDGGNNVRGGAWARVIGVDVKRENVNRFAASDYNAQTAHQTKYKQDIYGVMFGADGAVNTANGGTWLLGLTGGVVQSRVGFTSSSTRMDYTAGTAGAYASYVQGGGFFNALLKGDFGSTDYRMSNGAGISTDQRLQTNTLGLLLDGGYRFRSGVAFLEPSLSVAGVSSTIKDREFLATQVDFGNGNSLRTKLTLATGFSAAWGGSRWEPYLSLSAINESNGKNDVSLTSGGDEGGTVQVRDKQVKTYGQIGLGLKVVGAKGSSGFIRIAHEPSISSNDANGSDAKRESTSVSAGMKLTW